MRQPSDACRRPTCLTLPNLRPTSQTQAGQGSVQPVQPSSARAHTKNGDHLSKFSDSKRLDRLGRLDRANNGAGFSASNLIGTGWAGWTGGVPRVLPRGGNRGQFGPRFSCKFLFSLLVPGFRLGREVFR